MATLSNNHRERKYDDAAYRLALRRIHEAATMLRMASDHLIPAPPPDVDYRQLNAGEAIHRLMDQLGEAEVLRLVKLCAIGRGVQV